MSNKSEKGQLRDEAGRAYLFDMLAQLAVLAQSIGEPTVAGALTTLVGENRTTEGNRRRKVVKRMILDSAQPKIAKIALT